MSVRDELIGLIEADAGIDEECAAEVLDALLADPSAVLAELENAKCPECVEAREQAVAMADGVPALSKKTADAISAVLVATSDALGCACGGSGKLGRDGLLRLLVPEGYELVERDGPHYIEVTEDGWSIQHPARCRPDLLGCLHHRCIEQHVAEYDVVCVDEPGRYSFVVDDDGGPTFTLAPVPVPEPSEGPTDE